MHKAVRLIFLIIMIVIILPILIWLAYSKLLAIKYTDIAEEYLSSTYEFEWKVGKKVEQDIFSGYYAINVYPVNIEEVNKFTLYAKQDKIIQDDFIERFTEGRLKSLFGSAMKEIWGSDAEVSVTIRTKELGKIQSIYTCETPLKEIVNDCTFYQKWLLITLSEEIDKEAVIDNIWESILYIREELPNWDMLSYHVDGSEKYYGISFKNDVIDSEDIEELIREYQY